MSSKFKFKISKKRDATAWSSLQHLKFGVLTVEFFISLRAVEEN
jgi:hypothetical protein